MSATGYYTKPAHFTEQGGVNSQPFEQDGQPFEQAPQYFDPAQVDDPNVFQRFQQWWWGPVPQQVNDQQTMAYEQPQIATDGYETPQSGPNTDDQPRTIHQCVERFTHNLKLLTVDLYKSCPNDATVYRAKQRVVAGIAADPLKVVRLVGPYLMRYRNEIDNFGPEVETFFLENTFDAELKASANKERVDLAQYIIPKVKEIARSLPHAEKQQRITLVSEMLGDYIEATILLSEQQ